MSYTAIRETLNSKPTFIVSGEDFPISSDKDYYSSLFQYTEDHKRIFEEKGTLAGIKDTTTDKLYFDFDSINNLEAAREDAIKLAIKLVDMGVPSEALRTTFSGAKGYSIEFKLNKQISQPQFKAAVFKLAEEYPTFDQVVNDANRVIRILNTKHPVSGLYKIPLTEEEITTLSSDQIKVLAKTPRELEWNNSPVALPEEFFKTEELAKIIQINPSEIDFSKKAKGWSNCKWSLLNGNFTAGNRHYPIMSIIATSRSLGYPKSTAYYMAKSASKLSVERNGGIEYDKEEMWRQVEDVYSDTWAGGSFSCKDGKAEWLSKICTSLGVHKCKKEDEEQKPIKFEDLKVDFKHYVKNIDKNTIKTGLPTLDENVFLSTGANVCIIGSAGSGKTSIGLEILNHTSKAGVRSVVASLDMARNRIFEKIMYRISGLDRQSLYKTFQEDKEGPLLDKLNKEFGNVNFFKKGSPTVQDIKEYVLRCNEGQTEKIKLVVLDYFERVSSDYSDDTASSKKVAGELQDLVDELDICLITLVQPNKNSVSGGPDQPIYNYTAIKGSSFVYQSMRIILSCWRPFYHPKDFSNDHFMQMAILKNDLGELNEMVFSWEGKRGKIGEMDYESKERFYKMLEEKKPTKEESFF